MKRLLLILMCAACSREITFLKDDGTVGIDSIPYGTHTKKTVLSQRSLPAREYDTLCTIAGYCTGIRVDGTYGFGFSTVCYGTTRTKQYRVSEIYTETYFSPQQERVIISLPQEREFVERTETVIPCHQ